MKFYIATRFNDREKVRELHTRLKQLGQEITADWTTHDPLARYGDLPDKAREYAVEDLDGVAAADVFVLLSAAAVGTGMHTELGVAIQAFHTAGKPRVFVVGEHTSRSIMYFHPHVSRRPDFEAVLKELQLTQ